MSTRQLSTDHVKEVLSFIRLNAGVDGAHHKQWLIDQIVRLLAVDEVGYDAWVKEFKNGADGPDTYDWDEGVAP